MNSVKPRAGAVVDRLTIIEGPAHSGKTMALVNAAKAALLRSRQVLFVTFEETEDSLRLRFDSALRNSGTLSVWPVGVKAITPDDLIGWLEVCREGGRVFDAVFVDFANLMAPNKATGNLREDLLLVLRDLHAIADDFGLDLMTAVQSARVPVVPMERKKADDTEGGSCD
jgi:hypothetical protein